MIVVIQIDRTLRLLQPVVDHVVQFFVIAFTIGFVEKIFPKRHVLRCVLSRQARLMWRQLAIS